MTSSSWCPVPGGCWRVDRSVPPARGFLLHHSLDFVRWTPAGPILDRRDPVGSGTPTLRHHRGTFYLVYPGPGPGPCLLVTAEAPQGPWSDPVRLEGAPGPAPALFFDDDGRAWLGAGSLRELDLGTLTLRGPEIPLDEGLDDGSRTLLVKREGWYYLTAASGTRVAAFRSRDLGGPWDRGPDLPGADLVEGDQDRWWVPVAGGPDLVPIRWSDQWPRA